MDICKVKGISVQKPAPNWLAISSGAAPMASRAATTASSVSTTNTKASGNHFSAQAVKP